MAAPPRTISQIVQYVFALLLILSLVGLSLWLVRPFLGAITWAAIIAITIRPLHGHIAAWLGGRKIIAAAFLGLVMAGVLVVPLFILLTSVGEHASRLIHNAPGIEQITIPSAPTWLPQIPLVGKPLLERWQQAAADLPGTIELIRPRVREATIWLLSRTVKSTLVVLEALLAIVFAAIFLVTADKLTSFFTRLLAKLGVADVTEIHSLIVKTIRGVSQGVIGTALIQAVIAWIGYAIADAPFPMVLTLVTFITCTVQLGALIVGVPVAAWMWYQGDLAWAVFIVVWLVLVNLIDNVIKPLLMGRGLPVPIWVVFLGVLGGLFAMGLVGLFIGPVILSVSYLLLMHWLGPTLDT